jgi:hypothetical protein
MRREREDDDETTGALQHPSRQFVPFGGRYFLHFDVRDAKGIAGHDLRLMLHSNGLCMLALAPSNILVTSHFNVLRSTLRQEARAPRATAGADAPDATSALFKRMPLCAGTEPRCAAAGPLASVASAADLAKLVAAGSVAVCATAVSHTVNGTRGQRDRLAATTNLIGKRKRNAVYMQHDTTVCSFPCETFALCAACGKWRAASQAPTCPPDGAAATPPAAATAAAASPTLPLTVVAPYSLPRVLKIPLAINAVVMEVNPALAENCDLALHAPLNGGFIAIMQPRANVSFSGFARVDNAAPFVSPGERFREFVFDAFTGVDPA